jgi:hypothetical protein
MAPLTLSPEALRKKVADLEARIRAIELRLGDKQLSKLTDNPPTVENAFVINEVLKCAKQLAQLKINDADLNAKELSNEILGRLADIGL